ncbi:MAG: biotin/lipoyl-containing protein, partial [Rubrivivax sp.]
RRAEMGAAAVAAARAVGYVGAGTVEFIAEPQDDGDLRFYFMEMNTRLQVEHPVTEAITGHDLVEWQLRVAHGERLPALQAELVRRGHAIEARICAENPDANFLPATGTLQVMRWPLHVGFTRSDELPRVDTGFGEGDAISPYYDSMIAKLIVWGADRAQALARMDAALRDTHIVGLHTNVAFLRRVLQSRAFATADLDTALIERERTALFDVPGLSLPLAAAGVVARLLAHETTLEDADPWSRRDGWRLTGGASRRFELDAGGQHHALTLQRLHDGGTVMTLGDESVALATQALGADRFDVALGGHRHVLTVYAVGEKVAVFGAAGSALIGEYDLIAHAGDVAGEGGRLAAPMPGKVLSIAVKAGDKVQRGQPLAVMEAMKMEHTIHAPSDGVVAELLYAVGDQVNEGAELLRLEVAA